MGEKTNISVILPLHMVDDSIKEYFGKAIVSLQKQQVGVDELVIVVPADNKELIEFVDGFDYKNVLRRVILNPGKTDFPSQFNLGVQEAKSEWVSLLEVDDIYSDIWFKNVVKYRNTYKDVGLFMPIVVEVNKIGDFQGFTNETVWASQFSDKMGVLDFNTLLEYENFNFAGMVIKKEYIESFGGIKTNVKLTFMYEFLLRMLNKGVEQMTIPKFGYQHMNQRDGSLFNEMVKDMTPTEGKWWLSLAKRECYQIKERDITYEEGNL